MDIILNEREWAEDAIESRSLGKRPAETLWRLARYYYQAENRKKNDVRKELERFLLRCDPDIVLIKWSGTVDKVVKSCHKMPLIQIDGIPVTSKEMDVVKSADGKQAQRLAFTLLCVAKYWNMVHTSNNGWTNIPDKDIMQMANVKTSIKRQSEMLRKMKDGGLIGFSRKVDNLNIQVKFIDDDTDDMCMAVSDVRNIGNQLMLYYGESYFRCEQCGVVIKRNSPAHKYCPKCAAEMYIKQSVGAVMRSRCG